MNLPEIKQFRVDVSGKSPENLVPRERIPANDERSAIIIVPRHAPFFILSLNVYAVGNPNPLVKGEDYDFTSIDDELSEFAGAPVGWTIRKLKPNLPDLEITYQTLGTVPALTKTTKSWYESAAIDQRPVWFDQLIDRPSHFIPKLHGHDLEQGFYYFQRLVRFYEERLETLFGTSEMIPYRDWFLAQLSNLGSYMIPFRTLLNYYTNKHYAHENDPHRTTSRKVPGLDLIDPVKTATVSEALAGHSDKLRTLSAHAAEVIADQGIVVEDHVVPQFNQLELVGDTESLRVDRIATGLGDIKASCWIGTDGQGYGLAEFWDKDGSVINRIFNPNPLDLNSKFEPCQWKNTHLPFHLESIDEPVTRMIPGGNGKCHIVGTKDRWYCRVADSHRPDGVAREVELTVSGDFAKNWSEYQLTIIGQHIWLTRTTDYNTTPTLLWYVVKLNESSTAVLSEYQIVYKTINDGTARSDYGKMVLFPRGFTGGKYTSGDIVLSKGVDVVEERQRVVLLPTLVDNELHVEFMLPEVFMYNGIVRRYTHSHMAKCVVDPTGRKITLTYTDQRPRPYVQTDLLFRPNPEANTYFNQIATQFPTTMGNLSGSVVMMDREGFFGFGYTDYEECGTYGYSFMPELYTVTKEGREWYLDVGTPWGTDRRGTVPVSPVLPLDVNHPNGVQPYFGVMGVSEQQPRTMLVKGWNKEGHRVWFVKTDFDDVDSRSVLGNKYHTSGYGGEITMATDLHPDVCVGTYLTVAGSDFFMATLNSSNPEPYLPSLSAVSTKGNIVKHWLKPTTEFLAKFNVSPEDHWTLVSGHAHGFPDLLYVDRINGVELRTTVHVFTMSDETYRRVDDYHKRKSVTVLGDEELTVHATQIVPHTLPYGILNDLVDLPELSLHSGSINLYRDPQGELTVLLCPKTQAGDLYEHVNLNTVLTLNPDNTIKTFISPANKKERQNFYLTDDLGWVSSSMSQQRKVKGLVNVGTKIDGLPVIPGSVTKGKLGAFNPILDTQHITYYPPNIMLGDHQQLIALDWLSYDFRSHTPASGEITYTVVMEIGYQGPYLWAVKGNVINDGIVVVDTVTLNGNGIK